MERVNKNNSKISPHLILKTVLYKFNKLVVQNDILSNEIY